MVATFIFAVRGSARVPQATLGLNVVALVLVVIAAATILPYEIVARRSGAGLARGPRPAPRADAAPGRDIYFLIFDRYGSADALERRFDITDNDLYGWLEERGFQVPANSHANYRATDFSLAATLNMQYLDNLTRDSRPHSGRPDAGAGHDPGPRGRPLPEVAGISLLPDRVVVRPDPLGRDRR